MPDLDIERLVSLVLQDAVRFRLPLFFLTKAESCRGLQKSALRDLIPRSVSCDGLPPRRLDGDQCGVCTSCIVPLTLVNREDSTSTREGILRLLGTYCQEWSDFPLASFSDAKAA